MGKTSLDQEQGPGSGAGKHPRDRFGEREGWKSQGKGILFHDQQGSGAAVQEKPELLEEDKAWRGGKGTNPIPTPKIQHKNLGILDLFEPGAPNPGLSCPTLPLQENGLK